jgi:phage recombination protein Bet
MPETKALVQTKFDTKTISLIKRTVAVGATDDELKMFIHQATKSGLDPLARQIYFIKRKSFNKAKGAYEEKVNIQASIDGLRLVAQRSNLYAGQDEPEYGRDEKGEPFCKVRVYKWHGNTRYQVAVGVAYWKEYCPPSGQDFMWKKMPHTMLAKVAEALALRKAFPQELSGIYSAEEMDQSGEAVKEVKVIKQAEDLDKYGELDNMPENPYTEDVDIDEVDEALEEQE